jgi:hypothetical protein
VSDLLNGIRKKLNKCMLLILKNFSSPFTLKILKSKRVKTVTFELLVLF